MHIRILAFVALAFVFCVVPVSAQGCPAGAQCFTFDANTLSHTFDFGVDGAITFQFDAVLASFELDVSAVEDAPFTFTGTDFPATTTCIPYNAFVGGNGGHCVRYNVTGAGGGSVPVKGVNFRGLITVTLRYESNQSIQIPAFGHAPGDATDAAFSENILTSYVDPNAPSCSGSGCGDPTMGGKTPGISSFEAFNVPFDPATQTGDICSLSAVFQKSASGQNPLVEVSFKLVSGNCFATNPAPTPLRDKTATLSVAFTDTSNHLVFANLINGGDANKFHFDNTTGTNVQDINTSGLAPRLYYVTVISTKFPPVTTTFTVQ